MKLNIIKQTLLILLLTISCIDTQAQGIDFEKGSWSNVKEKATKTNKLIFMDIYTTWCGPCKTMDKNVFSTKEIGSFFNKNFISYKIDAEKGEGITLNKKYGVSSYPTVLIIDANGQLVLKGNFMRVKTFLEFGERALNTEKETKFFNATYSNGNRSPEFILKYLSFLKERELPSEEIVLNYLASMNKEEWLKHENLSLIKEHLRTPYNSIYSYLAKQETKTLSAVSSAMSAIHKRYVKFLVNEKRSSNEVSEFLEHLANSRVDPKTIAYHRFVIDLLTAKRNQDWDRYSRVAITYINTYKLDDPAFLNIYAYALYKNANITEPKVLNVALGWIELALKGNNSNNYYYLDTKASLLYKLGKKEEALSTANKAVEIMKKLGGNASETVLLIKKIKSK